MNILIVSSDNIPHIGGKSTHILDLMDGLKHNGHCVKLINRKNIKSSGLLLIKFVLVPIWVLNRGIYIYLYTRYITAVFSLYIDKILKSNGIDIISVQDTTSANAVSLLSKKYDIPCILTMHTYFGKEHSLDNRIIKPGGIVANLLLRNELNSVRNLRSIITVDNRIKEHVSDELKKLNYESIPVTAISNFTNITKFSPVCNDIKVKLRLNHDFCEDDFLIICSRRLVEKNGVKYAIEAVEKINDERIKLVIIGEGVQGKYLESYVVDHSLSKKVFFVGNISNDSINLYYNMADISIVPSITVNGLQEATSISALESMSCGVPVIASNIGGLKEIINVNTGILVNERSTDQIVESIKLLSNNPQLLKKMSKTCREYIEKNNSHIATSEKYVNVFKRKDSI